MKAIFYLANCKDIDFIVLIIPYFQINSLHLDIIPIIHLIKKTMDLKTILTNISERWKYKIDETSPGIYRIDVAMKQKDGNFRYQYVYAWL